MSCFSGHPRSPNWTLDFEPAFSPRFLPTLSPRSFFHTRQRFPISNHVTSGSHEPAIPFSYWSAVSLTGNDMTSSSGHVIALDQSGARKSTKRAPLTTAVSDHFTLPGHSINDMELIPLEPIHLNRDSIRKVREAFLISKAKTLEPHGINRRDET